MLRLWNSPTQSPFGFVETSCPRCQREEEVPLGGVCRSCRGEIDRRSRRVALLVATLSTVAVAIYVSMRLQPGDVIGRQVGIGGIVIWFALSFAVTLRTARLWIR